MPDSHVTMIIDKIATLEHKEDQRHEESMEAIRSIHRKQDTTNGRISKLERSSAYIKGAVAVIITLVLPILFMILTRIINNISL